MLVDELVQGDAYTFYRTHFTQNRFLLHCNYITSYNLLLFYKICLFFVVLVVVFLCVCFFCMLELPKVCYFCPEV